jgi:hypothetical protein
MTLEQINELVYTDIIGLLQSRLFIKNNIEPVDTLYFSVEELEAELVIYKSELIATENERLRRVDLEDRFNSLSDMRQAFHSLHSEPNPSLWLKNLLLSDPDDAELKMAELEAKDSELNAVKIASDVINNKLKNGAMVRTICSNLLDLVAGNNLEKGLTIEQIDQMETDYSDIFKALQNLRPDKAKSLIVAMTPDGVLVTDDDKAEYLAEFLKYGV